jgi:predicted Na+-dependent transporter
MFNADLALSVTMTAISTILSVIALPANLLLYSKFSYDDDVVSLLDWTSLFTALIVVIGAIALGLICSAKIHSHRFNVLSNKVCVSKFVFLVLSMIVFFHFWEYFDYQLNYFMYTFSMILHSLFLVECIIEK